MGRVPFDFQSLERLDLLDLVVGLYFLLSSGAPLGSAECAELGLQLLAVRLRRRAFDFISTCLMAT